MINQHYEYMQLALKLAAQGRFTTKPNPMVGCVIVNHGRIVGMGYHTRAGEKHAEIIALEMAGENAQGSSVYITLEPCCHSGRTPPCVQALRDAGISQVFAACRDPNPLVDGKGLAFLQAAGIMVHLGLCGHEAQKLNKIFFHYIMHKTPYVIAKWAMSLDGKTITHLEDEKKISNDESHGHAHDIRREVAAILIGAKTARLDDPYLTARVGGNENFIPPRRIVLTSTCDLPLNLRMFEKKSGQNSAQSPIIITTERANARNIAAATQQGIEVIVTPANEYGLVDLKYMLQELGRREIISLLVEGGMTIINNFFSAQVINKIYIYMAPVIIANLNKKAKINNFSCAKLDTDFLFSAECD